MPPKKEEGEEEQNDGVEKLFQPIDISRVQKFLYMTTTMLLVIALGVIVLAALTSDSRTRETSIISAVVMIIACCLAFYSGSYKDRGGLQLVFLLYVWQLGNGTVLLYGGLNDTQKLEDLCASASDPGECDEQKRISTAQAVLGVLSFFVGLATAWLVSNLSEKIQDEESQAQRKLDIRFAISAQNAKTRAVSRWQKSYGTGIRGRFKGLRSDAPTAVEESGSGGTAAASSTAPSKKEAPPGLRRVDTKPGAMTIPALPHLDSSGNL